MDPMSRPAILLFSPLQITPETIRETDLCIESVKRYMPTSSKILVISYPVSENQKQAWKVHVDFIFDFSGNQMLKCMGNQPVIVDPLLLYSSLNQILQLKLDYSLLFLLHTSFQLNESFPSRVFSRNQCTGKLSSESSLSTTCLCIGDMSRLWIFHDILFYIFVRLLAGEIDLEHGLYRSIPPEDRYLLMELGITRTRDQFRF